MNGRFDSPNFDYSMLLQLLDLQSPSDYHKPEHAINRTMCEAHAHKSRVEMVRGHQESAKFYMAFTDVPRSSQEAVLRGLGLSQNNISLLYFISPPGN